MTIIDLVICIQLFFISTAWIFCANKYPVKETADSKELGNAHKSGTKPKTSKSKSKPVPQIDDDDII